ncbi:MAG: hypothetical protein A2020_04720 [Lentisphaerae bacterium GWF2_45_14]|nr:MAG: hypothetical protein A2020_04720 [Lentisphaerae bacterium GWF2_45_14]
MKADALLFRKANCPEISQVELPELNDNEILMQTEYSGVSIGTESSIINGKRTHNGTFPLVPGYMASGQVLATGKSAGKFKEGDRVCGIGARFSDSSQIVSVWGGHSSAQVLNVENVFKVPDKAELSHASMFILPAVGLNAISMANITEQDTVLISGLGLIGYFFADFCRLRGAAIAVIEPAPDRGAIAKRNITENIFSPDDPELQEKISNAFAGRKISVCVEATASKRLIGNCSRWLSPGARMIFLSWYDGNIELDYSHFHNNAVTAYFPTGSGNSETLKAVLEYFADRKDTMDSVITHTVPYCEAPAAYEKILNGDRSIYGMTIKWR